MVLLFNQQQHTTTTNNQQPTTNNQQPTTNNNNSNNNKNKNKNKKNKNNNIQEQWTPNLTSCKHQQVVNHHISAKLDDEKNKLGPYWKSCQTMNCLAERFPGKYAPELG